MVDGIDDGAVITRVRSTPRLFTASIASIRSESDSFGGDSSTRQNEDGVEGGQLGIEIPFGTNISMFFRRRSIRKALYCVCEIERSGIETGASEFGS